MESTLICSDCGIETLRTGPVQKYCKLCSEKRDLIRKKLWAKEHPLSSEQKKRCNQTQKQRKERSKEAGAITSQEFAQSISWYDPDGPDLLWLVRVAIPFSYAASKNHIYTMRGKGHIALRRESRAIRSQITDSFQKALHCMPVVHNKVWIDILAQKPNHKGDAVNVLDMISDAIQDAMGINDRWFCIRRLDWEIVKDNPRLFIGIGQDSDQDAQVCSYCGQIKPLSAFNRNKHSHLGVGRECKECRRRGRLLAKSVSKERQ